MIKLREPIALGQRVRRFEVDVRVDGAWMPWITNGASSPEYWSFATTATTIEPKAAVRKQIIPPPAMYPLSTDE